MTSALSPFVSLDGKAALVTGGGTGIGKGIALGLAEAGANVAIVNRSSVEAAESVAADIRAMGRQALVLKGDVRVAEDTENFVKQVLTSFGALDIVVNNAGLTRDSLLVRMSESDWDTVLDTNLKGAFLMTRAAVKSMMKQRSGKIVNVASVMGLIGNPGQANYCASKAGLLGLTRSIAKEVGSRNIQVNAIAPGFIETNMTDTLSDDVRGSLTERIPAGRLGRPEDIAGAVVFLCSPASDYITGHTLTIDGGMTI